MGEMTEADRKAFEHWWHYESGDGEAIDITGQAWQAALDHARGKQEPACFIQKEALSELRKYKDATTTVSSGRIRNPFGNPAPLYTAPPARNEEPAPTVAGGLGDPARRSVHNGKTGVINLRGRRSSLIASYRVDEAGNVVEVRK